MNPKPMLLNRTTYPDASVGLRWTVRISLLQALPVGSDVHHLRLVRINETEGGDVDTAVGELT